MSTLRQLMEQRISAQITAFKEVAGAANLESILTGRVSAPGCYIFTERDTAGANSLVTGVSQRVAILMAIVTVVRNVRDVRGTDADDENKVLRDLVSTALLNWTPSESYEPMEYGGGQPISFTSGFLYFKSTYSTAAQIRAI
jgi:hypothetical protein